ncbi:MAG: pentapeptide repeat-containing protein [Proteobacteria bacterium]|nr:pentapeptide repeat-containing protein [Pseudomonadota bacterium]
MCNSNNCLQNNREKIKKNRLQYRLSCLCGMAVIGIIIAICFYKWGACALGLSTDDWITKNLTLLILSLPVLVLLWYFRTHDVKQQIEKAQSNININLLNNGINLLLDVEKTGGNKRAAGLILLAQLRQQDEQLHPQIDAITQGVALEKVKLRRAQLQGINLQDAILQCANLRVADLQGAQLQDADLYGADLYGAKLQGANLESADLRSANLQDALYSNNTKFSAGFDPETEGMQKVD